MQTLTKYGLTKRITLLIRSSERFIHPQLIENRIRTLLTQIINLDYRDYDEWFEYHTPNNYMQIGMLVGTLSKAKVATITSTHSEITKALEEAMTIVTNFK